MERNGTDRNGFKGGWLARCGARGREEGASAALGCHTRYNCSRLKILPFPPSQLNNLCKLQYELIHLIVVIGSYP